MHRAVLYLVFVLSVGAYTDINHRQLPKLNCDQWGGDCSQCSHCGSSPRSWNVEWWYYAITPDADAVDHGDIEKTVNESMAYIRGIAIYSAQNITNKHTLVGYKPTSAWPGIDTSQPVQAYSGIQVHACVPVRGCYSILYELGANYTANDTHFRYWSDDLYVTNDTLKLSIPCGSFYNYNYATGRYDGPCADIELHYSATLESQPKQRVTNLITDATLALGAANMGLFPESLNAKTWGRVKIWNYQMPDDGYYGNGETITLMDYRARTNFRTYYGHSFGYRSGYDSGISNWLWLMAQNMTCPDGGCDFGSSVDLWVGGQFGPADFVYVSGEALRGETFVAIDLPARSDATAVQLSDGRRAIQFVQRMQSLSHEGEFQFLCPAEKFTPYSASQFTMHATWCPAQLKLRRKSLIPFAKRKTSTYTSKFGLLELDVAWLSNLDLMNETAVGPYPAMPYDDVTWVL